ncbi:hypothetical protein [Rhizobium hainanense]|uniref:Uncharacterized protein n=1 Tax=Rhizobium hainanense TaxID=52131 RepID=A0A1C3V5P5_9HYPH|nr:hypothetical protein [Rhizobium hainanense]SCB22944.1 hypothetical protein GA0061100_104393 [Rhizobium hainanense]
MSDVDEWKSRHILIRMTILAALAWLFFCLLVVILFLVCTELSGYRFLPSTEWIASTGRLGVVVGAATAVALFLLGLSDALRKLRNGTLEGTLKPILVVLVSPVLGYFWGYMVGIITWPMVLALVAGHHEELAYTVGRADNHYEKHCYSPLELQELMVGFDKVCGVSDEFRKGLTTGTHIIIAGYGTRYGLFATELRRDN